RWGRMGDQRRVISAAFSVERRAKVISLGQFALSCPGAGNPARRMRLAQKRAQARRVIRIQAPLDRQIAARRTREDTTSVSITMATMRRITVAASRSLKERIVSQR